MQLLTREELKEFFDKKTKLIESEEIERGLCDYRDKLLTSSEGQNIIGRLNKDIQELAEKNKKARLEFEKRGEYVKATLKNIDDDIARNASLMHYYDCTSWESIAAILHVTIGAVKTHVYRNLTKAGIK